MTPAMMVVKRADFFIFVGGSTFVSAARRAVQKEPQARVPVDLKNLKSCFEEQHEVPQL